MTLWKAVAVAALALVGQPVTATTSHDASMTFAEWSFVCSQLRALGYEKVDCRKIDRPTVVITAAVEELAPEGLDLYGVTYDGEDQILINPTLKPAMMRTIIVHEAVHYVLFAFYGDSIKECKSEEVARIIHHKWMGVPYDAEWKTLYECK